MMVTLSAMIEPTTMEPIDTMNHDAMSLPPRQERRHPAGEKGNTCRHDRTATDVVPQSGSQNELYVSSTGSYEGFSRAITGDGH